MINKSDITILVNGKIEKDTSVVLINIRNLFPESKIILSTWKNSNMANLNYDVLVENDDPGARVFNAPKWVKPDKDGFTRFTIGDKKFKNIPKQNNVNRIIQTIKSGIEKVETKYLLRIRTDLVVKNINFLNYWDKFQIYDNKYKIFKHRLINSSTYSQFAHVMRHGIQLLPFHMSDWLHFGLTEDIKLLYSCPFQNLEYSSQYWYNKRQRKQYDPFIDAGWQFPPETYVLYSLVKKYFPNVEYKDSDDYNKENMSFSNKIIANNFINIDDCNFKFVVKKYPRIVDWSPELYDGFITYLEWQNLYKVYCDKLYKFCDIDFKRLKVLINIFNLKLLIKEPKKHLKFIIKLLYYSCFFRKNKLRKYFCVGE